MPPHRTLTGKEAMASCRAEFLAAHDRTQNGREAMASCRAEFIAARDLTPMWAEFEAAKAEWVVDTTRNMSTCDPHYWPLKGHCFSFATFF